MRVPELTINEDLSAFADPGFSPSAEVFVVICQCHDRMPIVIVSGAAIVLAEYNGN